MASPPTEVAAPGGPSISGVAAPGDRLRAAPPADPRPAYRGQPRPVRPPRHQPRRRRPPLHGSAPRLLPAPGGRGLRDGGPGGGQRPPVGLAVRALPAGRAQRRRLGPDRRRAPRRGHARARRARPQRRAGLVRLLPTRAVGAFAGAGGQQPRGPEVDGAGGHRGRRRRLRLGGRAGRVVRARRRGDQRRSAQPAPAVPVRADQPTRATNGGRTARCWPGRCWRPSATPSAKRRWSACGSRATSWRPGPASPRSRRRRWRRR